MVENSSIFNHYAIEQIKMWKNAAQIWQMPAGHHREFSARSPKTVQGRQGVVIHHSIVREGAIVIGCKQQIVHGSLMPRPGMAVATPLEVSCRATPWGPFEHLTNQEGPGKSLLDKRVASLKRYRKEEAP